MVEFTKIIRSDRQFRALCGVPDIAILADDPDYATIAARVVNRDALRQIIAAVTSVRDKAAWIGSLEAAGVPGGPINTVAEALSDPQALACELVIEPEGISGLRSPMRFSRSRLALQKAGPRLGKGDWQFRSSNDNA